ncbi:hypothetical protein J6P59_06000 [bacterium]|nr:hypothetical protein [bacterium]
MYYKYKNNNFINNDFDFTKYTHEYVLNNIKQNTFFVNFINEINNNTKGKFNIEQYIKFSYPLLKKYNKQLFDETLVKEYKTINNSNNKEIFTEEFVLLTKDIDKKDLENFLKYKKEKTKNNSQEKNKQEETDDNNEIKDNKLNQNCYLIIPEKIKEIEEKEKKSNKTVNWYFENKYPLIM